jgi:2,4-dienoyl-CoA reductase-like NADH-dependent reductase (Old Yellow Enzyme family)
MRHPSPGRFRSVVEFRAHLQAIGAGFDLDDACPDSHSALAQPLAVHGRSLPNRFCCQPMEGWDGTADGRPTANTLRRWRHFGRSGAAVLWGGEAFAVRHDGRANKNQLCLGAESEHDLAALLAAFRQGRTETAPGVPCMLGLQLTHSGRFARPDGRPAPRIAHHHPLLSRKYGLDPEPTLLTDQELEAIAEQFVAAARLAQRAGFDFVDVKCCHGYLLHELLAAHTRPGTYGGDLTGRTRLHRRILTAIGSECPGLHIGVRLSAGDTAPFCANPTTRIGEPMAAPGLRLHELHFGLSRTDPLAFDLAEPVAFMRLLQQHGVQLVNVTLGSPYWNPHLQRPAAYPPSDGYLPPADPLLAVDSHLAAVAALKASCPQLVFVGTGYTYLQEFLLQVAQRQVTQGHVDLIGLGRLLLAYPELPADLLAGRELQYKRLCRTFSDCTTAPRNGMLSGCFPLDPHYQAMPEAARVKAIKQGLGK